MTTPNEQRRAPRKRATLPIPVMDVFRDQVVGQLGNLSVGGLMLIGAGAPLAGLVRQVVFTLPDTAGNARRIEIGIQEQWHEPAALAGQFWSGYRLVAASDDDIHLIDQWVGPHPD
ncbi:PilZ domain-containing protein [Luteibacter sp. CQ10]|uniref:PilZ domain-containing protein n=1 Tax=Luteibacter sp. CQ10 TaxID=2805821 RepID=UPI0034A4C3C4